MGMLSLFAHGAAEAGSQLINKYIDEEMQQRKAEALADLQRRTASAIREDDDKFKNDPIKIARDRKNKVDDITAESGARNAADVSNRISNANNPQLTAALDSEANAAATRTATATAKARPILTAAEIDAEVAKRTNPDLLKARAGEIAAEGEAKSAAERQAQAAYANDPAARAGVRAKAKDSHYESAADGIRADILREQLTELRNSAKIPPAVKTAISSLQEESKQISAAIIKVQAENMDWDPANKPAQAELLARQRANNVKIQKLLAPYMPDGGDSGGEEKDPLGLFGDAGKASKEDAIKADMKKNGIEYAETNIGGKKGSIGVKPKEPGMLDKFGEFVGNTVDSMRREGAKIEELRRKVKSGAALTAEEDALAKRYGMKA